MALIQCPECNKEISDKAINCPHCGCPLAENKPESFPVDRNAVAARSKISKYSAASIVIVVVAVVALVIVFLSVFRANQREEYIDNLLDAKSLMLSGAAKAESLCNLTRSVWSNTIYKEFDSETYKYTLKDYKDGVSYHYYVAADDDDFNDDFNTSLMRLFADSSVQQSIIEIEAYRSLVDEAMKSLQNPTDEFAACFDTLSDMYDSYWELTNLAVSPSGNLITYSENLVACDEAFMRHYNKLDTQIPEK